MDLVIEYMTHKITDFEVYPETGRYKADVSNDVDIFYLDIDQDGIEYLVRIAIAVNKDGMNLGDLYSINYPELLKEADARSITGKRSTVSGFYVIYPLDQKSTFITGDFNNHLIPYLLERNLVKPQGYVENYDLKTVTQPRHDKPQGFSN